MQPESSRQLLRHIGSTDIRHYLTSVSDRKRLGYPQQCLAPAKPPPTIGDQQLTGLDCEMVLTSAGHRICRVVAVDCTGTRLYDRWFDAIAQDEKILDLITHVTGVDEQAYQQKMKGKPMYGKQHAEDIQQLIKGKVLVGHDLTNDLSLLQITHQMFIDTVALLPHHFGLPNKNKLKDLALTYLKKYIQWSSHDPFEDALTCLGIVRKHISEGRGTIEEEPYPARHYHHYREVLKDAELQEERVLFLALRGSRALGISVEDMYVSDWDYLLVYDTESELDGRLIKLHNVDITFFDRGSFARWIELCDISYIEALLLPREFIYINKLALKLEEVEVGKLRESLGFHVSKCRMKIKRYSHQKQQKYRWKSLKSFHLIYRLLSLFKQLFHFLSSHHQISAKLEQKSITQQQFTKLDEKLRQGLNVRQANWLWFELQNQLRSGKKYEEIVVQAENQIAKAYQEVNLLYSKSKMIRHKEEEIKSRHHYNKIERLSAQQCHSNSKASHQVQKHSLYTVNYLREKGVNQIEQLRMIAKRHGTHPNLVQLHYMQSADFRSSQIARECRGLIVDQDRNFQVVALPYFKFFDYNDPQCSELHKLDWASARIFEKKDGSIAVLYHYAGQWHVSSSTVPDGSTNYCFARAETTVQFRHQFWNTFNSLGFQLPDKQDSTKTFVFELMSRNHIIVVKREKSELCLHGVRDIRTLQEEDPTPYENKYGWVVSKPLVIPPDEMNIEALVQRAEALDPLKSEGFVVCDENWFRIKIKNSSYVRINWLGELNLGYNKDPKKYLLTEIILSGEAEVFSKYCPQMAPMIQEILGKLSRLNEHVYSIYEPIKDLDKTEFAKKISKLDKTLRSLVFALRDNPEHYRGKIETVLSPKKLYNFLTEYK